MQFFILLAKGALFTQSHLVTTTRRNSPLEITSFLSCLGLSLSLSLSSVSFLPLAYDEREERGGEGEKRLRETGGERASSNQRFTICQSSSNKLSEFYSRPV